MIRYCLLLSIKFSNRIDVLSSTCGYIADAVFPTVCGAPDKNVNIHRIRIESLEDATILNYAPITELVNGYVETCE